MIVTAGRILRGGPNVVLVVPLTRTIRETSVEHVRSVAVSRVRSNLGNVGPVVLQQIRTTLAVIFDI